MVYVPPSDQETAVTAEPASFAPRHGDEPPRFTPRGSPAYWRITIGLFLTGYATFSLVYCVQPLLPVFAAEFGVGAAASSLALSLTTGTLAVSILCAGALSENLGRKWLMFASMCTAAVLNIAAAAAPSWHLMLVARALEGFALGGVPAVAMAYLAEEIDPRGLGLSMGLYVGGTAFGGMTGRVLTGYVADAFSWPAAIGLIGVTGLVSALCFAALLPESKNFARKRGFSLNDHLATWGRHLRNPGLRRLFLIAFVSMGAFVTVYNYASFRLLAPPFSLSHSQIGLIFTAYLFGIASSSLAGGLSDRVGRAPVLTGGALVALAGLALTLSSSLAAAIAGIALVTIGFFAAHSIASGWVGRTADGAKGHAASLYLLAYYLGSSLLGSSGGWFWTHMGWPAVAAFCATLFAITLAIALLMPRKNRGV
ncbi:MFS transporter [Oleispirillum naphthae]|uniref:MFS transporter n=1 Tax=Oleispirillum naphthae TaxID=2838853 RepID=UPI00308234D9